MSSGRIMSRIVKALKVAFEFYETPESFTRYLFRDLDKRGHVIDGRLFEPCAGSGAIIRASGDNRGFMQWVRNDLDPRWQTEWNLDATNRGLWASVGRVSWTVTNPPFEPAVEILRHALEYSTIGVAMHLRATIHEPLKTGARRTFFREHPPTGILYLPRFAYQRSPTKGTWTSDSVAACWVVWLKGVREQFIDYAPPSVLAELEGETPDYRARMDRLMGLDGSEAERRALRIAA
jgi:hypothetical protein